MPKAAGHGCLAIVRAKRMCRGHHVWPHHACGTWRLYGHSHGKLPDDHFGTERIDPPIAPDSMVNFVATENCDQND